MKQTFNLLFLALIFALIVNMVGRPLPSAQAIGAQPWSSSIENESLAVPALVYAVWGSSASDVYAVGETVGAPLLYHNDGTGWSNALPVSVNAMPYAVIDVPGALDTTFDTDGRALTDFGNSDDLAQAIAVQPDGKILVAGLGSDKSGGDGMALVRYNSDGSLDLGFGTNGIVATFTGTGASADALAVQADGKIVVAGSSIMAGFVLVRYDSNGSVDPMFGTNGQVTTSFNANPLHYDYAHSIAIQSDGKIIAAGASYTGNYSDFALVRYETNGSLDTTFDGDGKVITDFGGSDDGYSIALQPDGKLVMAGGRWNGSTYDFALARYDTNGSLDTTFDGDGKVTTDLGSSEFSSGVALQTDGKIVLAGNTDGVNRNFVLARYNSSGSLDTTFDGDGKVTTDFGNNNDDDARSLAIQSNGKIIVTGSSGQGNNTDFALARYNSSGSLDTTFDGDGKVMTAVGSSSDNSYDIVLQSDGKIIIAGGSHNQLNVDVAIARYNTGGSLDTTFNGDGKVTTDLGGGSGYEFGKALALQSDGKIVVAGSNSNGNTSVNFAVARYNSDGSLDATFGTDGKVTTDFGLRTNGLGYTNYGRAVATQTDGKIIVAGSSGNGGGESQFALARYNTNGTLDTTFDGDGKATADFGGGYLGQGWAVAIQPDGKIIVAGDNGYPNSNYTDSVSFALARFNSNGSLDTTFDMDGKLTTSFGLGSLATIQAVTIQADGKIIVAGFSHRGSYSDFALARYDTNGSLDTAFDGDGKLTTTFGGASSYSYGHDLVLQQDGKIIVAGNTRAGPDIGLNFDLAVARYNANGSLDNTFDTDGKVITDFGNSADEDGWAVELQPDDRIVVAGRSYGSFALARYTPNGSLDPSFDTDGKVTVDFGSDPGGDAVLQPDGRILLAGSSWHDDLHTNYDFALARVILGAYEYEPESTIHYVKWNATGANDGTSWANAYTDLQSALSAASSGDEIWVAAGTYKPTTGTDRTISFTLKNGVGIYGGFAGTETLLSQRNPTANATILSGDIGVVDDNSDNSYHVAVGSNTDNTTQLDGFIVTNGNADGSGNNASGGGLYIYIGSPRLTNVIFSENAAGLLGGGMYAGGDFFDPSDSNPILENVIFNGNTAMEGGGLLNEKHSNVVLTNVIFKNNISSRASGGMENRSSATLTNVTFEGNTGGIGPGGMGNFASDANLTNVTFRENSATMYGGGMVNGLGNQTMTNVTFSQNSATYGGGMWNSSTNPTLINVTLSGNSATTAGGGIYNESNSNTIVQNTILWGNAAPRGAQIYNDTSVSNVNDSVVQDGFAGGTNIITTDPLLGALGNYGGFTETIPLQAGSSAIDAGDDINCPGTDQRGVARPQGGHCDIGAYEVEGIKVTINGTGMGSYFLTPNESVRKSYEGVNNGPVKIVNTDNDPIIGAERVIYNVNGVPTSFSEMMALPDSRLDNTYWMPWYNNVDLDTQLRFGNVSNTPATVRMWIGGQEKTTGCTTTPANVPYPYILAVGASLRLSCPGLNNGPVKIESNVNIVAAERVIYNVNGLPTSFTEMMGLPDSQLDTAYWLPWYNNVDLDTQLRFGNVSNTPATVRMWIGGQEKTTGCTTTPANVPYPYVLAVGASLRVGCPGLNSGPVQIVSNVNIVAAERVIYKVNGLPTSFTEMMGLPDSQLDTAYWMPWYNNVDLDTQLRFGNVSDTAATVRVWIGGQEKTSGCTTTPANVPYPYVLAVGASLRLSCPGLNSGPVQIVSNVNIVAAERVIYNVNGLPTSFTEMMGLPNSQLDSTYWLPWYNNVDLDTQLRFGVP